MVNAGAWQNPPRLWMLGIVAPGFSSADYFPLLPWVFLFFAGYYLYELRQGEPCALRLPFVTAIGRHSLLIYLLHQPLVYGALVALQWLGIL